MYVDYSKISIVMPLKIFYKLLSSLWIWLWSTAPYTIDSAAAVGSL